MNGKGIDKRYSAPIWQGHQGIPQLTGGGGADCYQGPLAGSGGSLLVRQVFAEVLERHGVSASNGIQPLVHPLEEKDGEVEAPGPRPGGGQGFGQLYKMS